MKSELIRGDTGVIEFDLFDDDKNKILLADIEEIICTARTYIGGGVLFRKTLADVINTENHYEIEIKPEDTEQLKENFGYDIEITLKDGTRGTLLGKIILIEDYSTRKDGKLNEN